MPVIVLDPGHGGSDTGATGNGLIEKNLSLYLATRIRDWLTAQYAVTVRMTRETDVTISLTERSAFANRIPADYFVSLHHNAAGGEGFESYVYVGTSAGRTGQLQRIIHEEIMSYLGPLGVRDRGRKEANFAVLRETRMPAILIENLFVDNLFDANLLANQQVLDNLARYTATGIAKAFNLTPLSPPQPANWKLEAVEWMFQEGLLTNEEWKNAIESPLPLWAEAIVLRRLFEKMQGN